LSACNITKLFLYPGKATGRKPAYKSQEEYYDEILELKKHIVTVNNDNTHMKSKLRRVEEDNVKKDKEIEQLLNPSKVRPLFPLTL
jgi:hypothetical protein